MSVIRWVIRYHRWPSRPQRDFMSRNPARRARVLALADQIRAEIERENGEE